MIPNGTMIGGYLVWVRGLRGPEAQKWGLNPSDRVHDYWKDKVLAVHPLGPEVYALELDELAARYPAPAQQADGPVVKLEAAP